MTHIHFSKVLRWSFVFFVAVTQAVEPTQLIAQPHALPAQVPYRPSVLTSLRRAAADTLTINNSRIKIGINKNAGGAITYLAFMNDHKGRVTTRNMVSNPDLGRQIQIGLYSGPVNYSDAAGWVNLGWDPIQAGDAYGNPSEVVEIKRQANLLYAKTIPKQFGVRNEPGEAIIEHWISLGDKDSKDSIVVKVHVKLTMFRSDKTQYEARQQEFPCVYLTGDYHNINFYKEGSPYTNGPLTVSRIIPPATSMFGDVFPTEPWMASTNENGYGVGLYVPDNYEWKRGYFGADLSGDEFSTVASYIAATNKVILDHDLVHEWDYELIVGHLNDIRSHVYAQTHAHVGPNFKFDIARKGWSYQHATDTGLPIAGKLHVLLDDAKNARIFSPFVFWKGRSVPKIYLRAAFKTQSDKFRMKWRRSDDITIYGTGDRIMEFPIINDGEFHTYTIDLSKNDDWLEQNIGQIQFEPVADSLQSGSWAEFAWVTTNPDGPDKEPVEQYMPPVVDKPVDLVACQPGCTLLGMKKLQYVRSNRKR